MTRLFNSPSFQAAMMLAFALEALSESRGDQLWMAYVMIVCSAFWMFRVWGGLRTQEHGGENL